ncbi:flagellar hook-length control protein FliK, partial [Pseudomonas aeruginosa]|nr:flagellar hook-length control protein FliK [Pseudomonas aeruginosa]
KAEVLAVKEGLANNFQVLLKLTLANSGQSLVEVQSNRPLVPGGSCSRSRLLSGPAPAMLSSRVATTLALLVALTLSRLPGT